MQDSSQEKSTAAGIIIGVEVIGILAMIGLLVYQKYMAPKGSVAQKTKIALLVEESPNPSDRIFELPELTPASSPAAQPEQPADVPEEDAQTQVVAETLPQTSEVASASPAGPQPQTTALAMQTLSAQPETVATVKLEDSPISQPADKAMSQPLASAAQLPEPITPDSPEIDEKGDTWQIGNETKSKSPNSAASGPPLPKVIRNPRIVVTKSKQMLEVFDGDKLLRTYLASTGSNQGDKEKSGDRKTPEGEFYVCVKNPKSRFVLSLGLSYPSYDDAKRGLREGLINQTEYNHIISELKMKRQPPWNTKLGGEVMIHGVRQGGRPTAGCIALENDDIRELYPRIPHGTKVIVRP